LDSAWPSDCRVRAFQFAPNAAKKFWLMRISDLGVDGATYLSLAQFEDDHTPQTVKTAA